MQERTNEISTSPASEPRLYHFGAWEYRNLPPRLSRDGTEIDLRRQCLSLLGLLLERAGEAVTRSEISRRLWAEEIHLDRETAINSAVSSLRRALGDDSSSPEFIETLPRKGYRFVAPVSARSLAETPCGDDESGHAAPGPTPGKLATRSSERGLAGLLRRLVGLSVHAAVLLGSVLLLAVSLRPPASPVKTSDDARLLLSVIPLTISVEGGGSGAAAPRVPIDLSRRLVAAIGRRPSSGIVVVEAPRRAGRLEHALEADYFLTGSVRTERGECRLSLVVLNVSDLEPVWSATYPCRQLVAPSWPVTVGRSITARLEPARAAPNLLLTAR